MIRNIRNSSTIDPSSFDFQNHRGSLENKKYSFPQPNCNIVFKIKIEFIFFYVKEVK